MIDNRLQLILGKESASFLKLFFGPVLLSFAILIAPSSLVATVSLLGLGATLFYGIRGALGTFCLLFVVFLFKHERFTWELSWHVSAGLSHVITAFALEEIKNFFKKEKEDLTTNLSELNTAHSNLEKVSLEEKVSLQEKLEQTKEKLLKAEEDILSLKRLSDAVRVESNKLYKENDDVKATLAENESEITRLRQEMETSQDRLNELNEKRVEAFQLKTLLEEKQPAVEEVEIVEAVETVEEVEQPSVEEVKVVEEEPKSDLEILEELKKTAKEAYQKAVDEKAEDVKDKRHALVEVERQLFNLKKAMRDQGALFK
ncbi:MAG: hypothetical protein SP1CHLAM54_02200 [Chlamydiia bacterium]|nr:hypothetical protein [Chlamydiia bacterium]MCH9615137.1 hypothetical protein [Chlamydiia bacterium]MCH9628541.1 hypothetical protein [Chlamydiia bacterium]